MCILIQLMTILLSPSPYVIGPDLAGSGSFRLSRSWKLSRGALASTWTGHHQVTSQPCYFTHICFCTAPNWPSLAPGGIRALHCTCKSPCRASRWNSTTARKQKATTMAMHTQSCLIAIQGSHWTQKWFGCLVTGNCSCQKSYVQLFIVFAVKVTISQIHY